MVTRILEGVLAFLQPSMLEIDLTSKSSANPSVLFDSLIPINKGCRVEDVSDNDAEG